MRPPLIPGHDEREILGFLRSGLNLPLTKFRQDQLSKGTGQQLPFQSTCQRSIFCFALDVETHVGLKTFVSIRPLP